MKCLKTHEANTYLHSVDMEIGAWNQITDTTDELRQKKRWVNKQAPQNAKELMVFSQHIAGWLPKGDWKLLQIDNSTSLDVVDTLFFGRLLFGSDEIPSLVENRTFLFEFGQGKVVDGIAELLLSNLIFALLFIEGHAHIVSSNSDAGQSIALQDGYVYLSSREEGISGASILLEQIEREPLKLAAWALEIVADGQE